MMRNRIMPCFPVSIAMCMCAAKSVGRVQFRLDECLSLNICLICLHITEFCPAEHLEIIGLHSNNCTSSLDTSTCILAEHFRVLCRQQLMENVTVLLCLVLFRPGGGGLAPEPACALAGAAQHQPSASHVV